MKGVSLPVNTVIIISLAIMVLFVVSYLFISGIAPSETTSYEQAFNRGCQIYKETGEEPSQIPLGDINKDGAEDTLLDVCKFYFSDQDMEDEDCENKCDNRFPG